MTDLIDIFNTDSRKSISKFSGLRWFLVSEDLYNREEAKANKTSKKQNLNLKQWVTSKLKPISLISYLEKKRKEKRKEKESCNKSVKLYFYTLH